MALTERLAIILETVGTSTVVKDFGKVSAAADGLGKASSKAGGLLKGLIPAGEEASGMLAAGIAGAASAAGAALVGFGIKSVNTFENLGQEVLKFQRASGTTAEQASALIAAFDDVGISAETGSKAIFQLGKRLVESGDKLAEFGVVAHKDSQGNTDLAATLKDVADAYVNTHDPAQRAALLAAAFGKTGQELIPILERGRAGIEAMYASAAKTGQILSQDDVQKAEDFRLAMDELHDVINKLFLDVGSALVPTLTDLVGVMARIIEKGEELADNPLVKFAAKAGLILNPLTSGLPLLSKAMDGVGGSSNIAAVGLAAFKAGSDAAGGSTEDLSKDVDKLEKSLLGVVSAERAKEQAERSVETATHSVATAQQKLNKLLADGAVDEKKVEQATRDLAAATRAHDRAVRDVADSQERVNTLTKELRDLTSGKIGAEKTADAQDDLTQAQIRQRTAQQRVIAAQNAYNKVSIDTESTVYDLTNAQIDLDQANLDLKNANEDVTKAQTALNDAQKIGAENSPEVIDKRKELKGATEDLEDKTSGLTIATQDLTDKTNALKAAQTGDTVQYNKDLAAARYDLTTAENGLADARKNLTQRSYELVTAQDAFKTKIGEGGPEVDALRTKFEDLLKKHPELSTFLDPLIADLDAANTKLGGAVSTLQGLGAGLQKAANLPQGVDPLLGYLSGYVASQPKQTPGNLSPLLHADGGIATRPTFGIFGEAGPEALIPLDRLTGTGGGGPSYSITVYALDPKQASESVIAAIADWERRNGTSWRN